jgi:flavin-binding protein dodecin
MLVSCSRRAVSWTLRPPRCGCHHAGEKEGVVEESVYRVIEVIGTSPTSWEEAARMAVETAGTTLEDLRVAEIVELDMRLQDNKVMAYRAKVKISFKYRI